MAMNNKTTNIWTSGPISCSFTSMGDNGIIIKLNGYPIRYIRITMNRHGQHYSVLFRDTENTTCRIRKVTELNDLHGCVTKMIFEEI